MNLGLGASLVLLLSKSAVELNKMVELRAQMEALVSEIRQAAQWRKEKASHSAAPAASSESNGSSSATTTAVKDPIAFPTAEADAASNCSRTAADDAGPGRAAAVMDLMEAELQAELSRMQRERGGTVHGGDMRIAPTQELEVRSVMNCVPPLSNESPYHTVRPHGATRIRFALRMTTMMMTVCLVLPPAAAAEGEDEGRQPRPR